MYCINIIYIYIYIYIYNYMANIYILMHMYVSQQVFGFYCSGNAMVQWGCLQLWFWYLAEIDQELEGGMGGVEKKSSTE